MEKLKAKLKGKGKEEVVLGVETLFELFAKEGAKRGFGDKLAFTFTSKEEVASRVAALATQLDEGKGFGAELEGFGAAERAEIAADLLSAYDGGRLFHCGVSLCECSEAELAQHQLHCIFRPLQCKHANCTARFSAHAELAHDEACELKPVTCRRGCGAEVVRCAMADHVDGDCRLRPVPCPFEAVGCAAPLTLGMLQEHMDSAMVHHLYLAVSEIGTLKGEIAEMRGALSTASEKSAAQATLLASVGAELRKLATEQEAAGKAAKAKDSKATQEAKQALAKLSQAQAKMEKSVRESLSSTAREVEELRTGQNALAQRLQDAVRR